MKIFNPKFYLFYFFCLLIFSSCDTQTKQIPPTDTVSFLTKNKINNNFLGHGVQWSAYPHADAPDAEWGFLMTADKWEELYRRLDFVQPHIIRVMDVAMWRYYDGLDSNGNAKINFDRQEVKTLYKLLDYCQNKNITVLFGEWGAPGFWKENKDKKRITEADDDRWIGMITQYLHHLIIDKKYSCIKYYNLVNEPNGNWSSTDGDYEEWKRGYQKLYQSLKDNKLLRHVRLSGPDAVPQPKFNHPTGTNGQDWTNQTMVELDSITALYDIHIYADQYETRTGGLQKFLLPFGRKASELNKPIILGEIGMKYSDVLYDENIKRAEADPYAGKYDSNMFVYDFSYGVDLTDAVLQSMNAGISGAVAWDLDDAMHTVGDLGEKSKLKKWGMWNILGKELSNDEAELIPRPWSYTWTMLCRIFPPGTEIIAPVYSTSSDSIRMVAGTYKDQQSFAIVNQSSETKSFEISADYDLIKQPFYLYKYEENELRLNDSGFPQGDKSTSVIPQKNKLTNIVLPPNSVQFISTILVE